MKERVLSKQFFIPVASLLFLLFAFDAGQPTTPAKPWRAYFLFLRMGPDIFTSKFSPRP